MARVVAITSGEYLSASGGLLRLRQAGIERTLPLADVGALLIDAPALVVSAAALGQLGRGGVPVVLADAGHAPALMLLPVTHQQAARRRQLAQAHLSRERAWGAWRAILDAKLAMQAALLALRGQGGFYMLDVNALPKPPDRPAAQPDRFYMLDVNALPKREPRAKARSLGFYMLDVNALPKQLRIDSPVGLGFYMLDVNALPKRHRVRPARWARFYMLDVNALPKRIERVGDTLHGFYMLDVNALPKLGAARVALLGRFYMLDVNALPKQERSESSGGWRFYMLDVNALPKLHRAGAGHAH